MWENRRDINPQRYAKKKMEWVQLCFMTNKTQKNMEEKTLSNIKLLLEGKTPQTPV
jgi:lactate dehydrogenase-like 2-hydroxyacid dehydrogenase